ncbi:acetaldehyde dehydrogenase [Streptomyces sp. TLI_053]|uniref:acetaldehyde dehydrogenase n=1 Tax=Streptomyces sp. TLI_053 TaxID=1855352 RepID=UPI000879B426|nr:acetaldehyde dehydrogenase [Streptomyces sp. TLI_053]SDT83428.1 acetaldehyde dehydrogenase [Streptomyces sp. TLI_053]
MLAAPLRAAVIGPGLLGLDLAERLTRSSALSCVLVAGRHSSAGLRRAERLGCAVSTAGIDAVAGSGVDVVFDASSAAAHPRRRAELAAAGVLLVDVTPAGEGTITAPTVNGDAAETRRHLSLASCGAQTVAPVLAAAARHCVPRYAEIVTTAASASVGPASRSNLDEYIATTGAAVRRFTGVPGVKVLTSLSPALPAPVFRAQATLLADGADRQAVREAVEAAAAAVRGAFAPGYRLAGCTVTGERITLTVDVAATAQGLPGYAGNVEIINAAAVALAERHAAARILRGTP